MSISATSLRTACRPLAALPGKQLVPTSVTQLAPRRLVCRAKGQNQEPGQRSRQVDQYRATAAGIVPWAQAKWSRLTLRDKAATVVSGIAGAWLLSQVALFGVIGAERIVVGALVTVEEFIVDLLLRGSFVAGGVAILLLLGWIYNVFFRSEAEKRTVAAKAEASKLESPEKKP